MTSSSLGAAPGDADGTRGDGAIPLRVFEGKALRGELAFGRAPRPPGCRRPSTSRCALDEEATAAALAETGLPARHFNR